VKKSKALSIVFVAIAIALNTWTALVVAGENGFFDNHGTWWTSDSPALTGVTRSNDHYNLSFAFSSANYSRELQNIIINPQSDGTITGLMGYVNGTIVNGPNPVFKYCLQANDTLNVNVMIPCEDFNPGTVVDVMVMGSGFGCGGTVLLP
jgi:hypothetical protein